jgi:hypothetical protein
MTSIWFAPTAKCLSLQRSDLIHELFVAQNVLSVLFDATVSSEFLHFEGVGPFATDSPTHIVGHVASNVHILGLLSPFLKVLKTVLPQKLDLDVDY